MADYSVQSSTTIRVLRTSDNLSLNFENNGIVLFQSIDTVTGAVSPDWTKAENQPIRIPVVHTTQGTLAVILMHMWRYNGVEINFEDGTTSGGWTTDTTGRFQLRETDGAIKIIKNLASEVNYADDILSYECQVSVAGVEHNMTADMTIAIQEMGASSFYGALIASSNTLNENRTSITIEAILFQGGQQLTSYDINWFRGVSEWTAKSGKTISVNRDDIDASQLIIAEFRKEGNIVARAGISIVDEADEYKLIDQITSDNKEIIPPKVDASGSSIAGQSVTVKYTIMNMRTKAEVTPLSSSYVTTLFDKDELQVIKTVNSNTMTISPSDVLIGDDYKDTIANCVAEFTI